MAKLMFGEEPNGLPVFLLAPFGVELVLASRSADDLISKLHASGWTSLDQAALDAFFFINETAPAERRKVGKPPLTRESLIRLLFKDGGYQASQQFVFPDVSTEEMLAKNIVAATGFRLGDQVAPFPKSRELIVPHLVGGRRYDTFLRFPRPLLLEMPIFSFAEGDKTDLPAISEKPDFWGHNGLTGVRFEAKGAVCRLERESVAFSSHTLLNRTGDGPLELWQIMAIENHQLSRRGLNEKVTIGTRCDLGPELPPNRKIGYLSYELNLNLSAQTYPDIEVRHSFQYDILASMTFELRLPETTVRPSNESRFREPRRIDNGYLGYRQADTLMQRLRLASQLGPDHFATSRWFATDQPAHLPPLLIQFVLDNASATSTPSHTEVVADLITCLPRHRSATSRKPGIGKTAQPNGGPKQHVLAIFSEE